MTDEEVQSAMELPTEIALAAMQGILASGVYGDNPQGAAVMAWHCVAPFYEGMTQYMMIAGFIGPQAPPEG